MFDLIKNKTVFANKYHTHSEAMIVSCFFNPQNSPYRIKAFKMWYESIKHLNHSIIECVIGDAQPQLAESDNIKRVYTENLLWHKEALLNKVISDLPTKYKYIFWVDADVIFTNLNWLVDGVRELQTKNIIQPFEYCVHLERDETTPSFSMDKLRETYLPNQKNGKVWRSFCASFATTQLWKDENYNNHGHVGFAWAARREILEAVPLYDKALIGGADHIIAHAAAGQIAHNCIVKSFTDNLDEVNQWSKDFYKVVNSKIGFVKGDLYHIWHGDIDKRQYLKRIQDFTAKTKQIVHRDKNGLFITNKGDDTYMKNYFRQREVSQDDGFLTSMAMGYMTDSTLLGTALGGNMTGAMIGDMLNNNDEPKHEFKGFGGGDTGGGGAGGTWDDDIKSDNTQHINSLNTNSNLEPFS
jgi:hypothetical protein